MMNSGGKLGGSTPTLGPPPASSSGFAHDAHPNLSSTTNGSGHAGSSTSAAVASSAAEKKSGKSLSHVPCKFFKQGSCTAGKDCVFSHDLTIPGTTKPICQWYAKGNCKFGHKCALAHILPGQPMSYDRKNKRAAQNALREAQGLPSGPGAAGPSANGEGMSLGSNTGRDGETNGGPGHSVPTPLSQPSAPPQQSGIARSLANSQELPPLSFQRMSPGPTVPKALSPPTAHRPMQQIPQSQNQLSSSPVPPAIFSTSPFSGSGRSLFLPAHPSTSSSPRASPRAPVPWPNQTAPSPPRSPSPSLSSNNKESEEDDDEDDYVNDPLANSSYLDGDEASFLPSSLSDLLTPSELRKRHIAPSSPPTAQFLLGRPYSSSYIDTSSHLLRHGTSTNSAHGPPLSSPFNDRSGGATLGSSLPKGLAAGLSSLHLRPAHSPSSSFLGSPPLGPTSLGRGGGVWGHTTPSSSGSGNVSPLPSRFTPHSSISHLPPVSSSVPASTGFFPAGTTPSQHRPSSAFLPSSSSSSYSAASSPLSSSLSNRPAYSAWNSTTGTQDANRLPSTSGIEAWPSSGLGTYASSVRGQQQQQEEESDELMFELL